MMSSWQHLLATSLRNTQDVPESRFFQLATVDQNGFPQNRTVVCRGFDEHQAVLWVVTDTRNQKVPELMQNPHASVCWYFSQTREQYRMAVHTRISTPDTEKDVCEQHWHCLSDAARQQFLWGIPGSLREFPERRLGEGIRDIESLPAHFCVLAMSVRSVDYLNLFGNPQQRRRFTLMKGDWQGVELIP